MEEYQKQIQQQSRAQASQQLAGTKHKANGGGVKEEPEGTEVAQSEKKRRMDDGASLGPIKVEIQREDVKVEPEPVIEFESDHSSAAPAGTLLPLFFSFFLVVLFNYIFIFVISLLCCDCKLKWLGEDPLVTIGDQHIPLTQVTDEHQTQMTPAEYEAYYKIYMDYYAQHQ